MPSGGFDKVKDCQAAGLACKAGSCIDGPCEPVDSVCGLGGMYSRDGCGHTQLATCCECGLLDYGPNEPTPFCFDRGHRAGTKFCVDDAVDVCGDEGGPVPCDSDSYCDDGVCKPRLCQVDETYCDGDQVVSCPSHGPPVLSHRCYEGDVCAAEGGKASCRRWWCKPGQAGCIANQSGECAADGRSLTSVASDCGGLGQVCDVQGRCAASVVDTLGEVRAGWILNNREELYWNELVIFANRVLTEIQAPLHLPTAHDVVWQVYEVDAQTREATLHCEATSFTPSVEDAFVSSGPLDCSLEAGRRYALALRDTRPLQERGAIVLDGSSGPFPLSFAEWTASSGMALTQFEPTHVLESFPGSDPFIMKLTTKSP